MAGEADDALVDDAAAPAVERQPSVYEDVLSTMRELQARPATPAAEVDEDDDDHAEALDDDPLEVAADDDDEPARAASRDDPLSVSAERWSPVMEQLGIDRGQVVDNYMSAVVALQQDPVSALAQLASTYLQPQQAQQMLAALAAQFDVDPLEVDVDDYRRQQPMNETQRELARLKAQIMQMNVSSLKSSGKFPLLDDRDVGSQVSATMGRYTDMSIEDAYALVVHRNPDLSRKHAKAVAGKRDAGEPRDDNVRRERLRRAKAADLPKGQAGEPSVPGAGGSVYDDIRAVAAEIGFGRS